MNTVLLTLKTQEEDSHTRDGGLLVRISGYDIPREGITVYGSDSRTSASISGKTGMLVPSSKCRDLGLNGYVSPLNVHVTAVTKCN